MFSWSRCLPLLILFLLAGGCGYGLAPVGPNTTGLTGQVRLVGAWPEDTGVVAVALFRAEPVSNQSEFPVVFTEAPAFGDSSFTYTWTLQPGSYGYLVVAWMREGNYLFDLASWIQIGYYPDPADPSEPGPVLITPGILRHLDLRADFSLVPPPSGGTRRGGRE